MKKIIMILAVTSAFLAVAGCASKACTSCGASSDLQPAYQDFKGEAKRK